MTYEDVQSKIKSQVELGIHDIGIGSFEYFGSKGFDTRKEIYIKEPNSRYLELIVDKEFEKFKDEFRQINIYDEFNGLPFTIAAKLTEIKEGVATYLLEIF